MSAPRICGRDLKAGPGSCWAWWESCPKSTKHCFIRFIRDKTGKEHTGSIDLETAQRWEQERDKARDPAPKLKLESEQP